MILGIDIGTSGTRAVLLDEGGRLVASATADHVPFRSPQTGWAEQDPEDWWAACQRATHAVLRDARAAGRVTAVGLSGQMHGAVLLDDCGAVVRPAIIWCDQRSEDECRWLDEAVGPRRLIELTANPALTNFTLTKLLWVRTREPELWARVRRMLLPKDFVRFRLSGEFATDVADASGTLLFDVAKRAWSREMIDAVGLDAALLPGAFESSEVCARVSSSGSAATGIPEGTPIVAGAGDQAAGAVGMGITRPGAVSATIGTSGVVFAATDRPAVDPQGRVHTFCHAIPDRWHVMGVTQAAGLSLRWLRDLMTSPSRPDPVSYDDLTLEAGAVPAGADGVLWAPYLMGERTPYCDPSIRAAFAGIAASHGRGHLVRAVMEGVAFSLRDTFAIFDEMHVPVERIRLGGGGARSTLWRQIQADVYGRPAETIAADEGAAFGAAILAAVGAGVFASVDVACEALVQDADTTHARPDVVMYMNARYLAYRRLYPALRQIQNGKDPKDTNA